MQQHGEFPEVLTQPASNTWTAMYTGITQATRAMISLFKEWRRQSGSEGASVTAKPAHAPNTSLHSVQPADPRRLAQTCLERDLLTAHALQCDRAQQYYRAMPQAGTELSYRKS